MDNVQNAKRFTILDNVSLHFFQDLLRKKCFIGTFESAKTAKNKKLENLTVPKRDGFN